jgi:CBS domain-containing protein
MRVAQLMTKEVRFCHPSSSLHEAARLMWEGDCGFVPVTEEGGTRVVGVITDRDVCMAAYTRGQSLQSQSVRDAMARQVRSCRSDATVEQAEAIMREAQVRRLPVVDGAGQLIGVLSLSDLAREAARERGERRQDVRAADVGETLATISQARQLPG